MHVVYGFVYLCDTAVSFQHHFQYVLLGFCCFSLFTIVEFDIL